MKQRKSKAEKVFDAMIEHACSKACQNIPINVFDLSKVEKKAREIHAAGGNLESELRSFAETLRAS